MVLAIVLLRVPEGPRTTVLEFLIELPLGHARRALRAWWSFSHEPPELIPRQPLETRHALIGLRMTHRWHQFQVVTDQAFDVAHVDRALATWIVDIALDELD